MAQRKPAVRQRKKSQNTVKYILSVTMHLGFCRDTFPAGTVIEHDVDNELLYINGRMFDDTRDLDILFNHDMLEEFDEERARELKSGSRAAVEQRRRKSRGQLPVVQSDEDDMRDPIDISHTQVAKNRQRDSQAETRRHHMSAQQRRTASMDVEPYDETPEERVARLTDPDDRRNIPIVRDDSLGMGFGGRESSLNPGMATGRKRLSARQVEQYREEGRMKAAMGLDTREEQGLPIDDEIEDVADETRFVESPELLEDEALEDDGQDYEDGDFDVELSDGVDRVPVKTKGDLNQFLSSVAVVNG